MSVSVVIPCHNQGRWLEEAIQSAFGARAYDIVIVDDASTDNTRRIITAIKDGIAPYIVYPRGGVCHTRNFGIMKCDLELIVCLDADDTLYPDALARLEAAWRPDTWVYGNYTEVDEDGNLIREVEAPPPGMLNRKNIAHATFLFHFDDWGCVGGFDPDFELGAEDYAFQVALTAAGVKPVKLDGPPIYRRMIHPHSRTERATDYFPLLHNLIRQKWPSVFLNT